MKDTENRKYNEFLDNFGNTESSPKVWATLPNLGRWIDGKDNIFYDVQISEIRNTFLD